MSNNPSHGNQHQLRYKQNYPISTNSDDRISGTLNTEPFDNTTYTVRKIFLSYFLVSTTSNPKEWKSF